MKWQRPSEVQRQLIVFLLSTLFELNIAMLRIPTFNSSLPPLIVHEEADEDFGREEKRWEKSMYIFCGRPLPIMLTRQLELTWPGFWYCVAPLKKVVKGGLEGAVREP